MTSVLKFGIRDYYVLGKIKKDLMEKYFPNEEHPDLLELERNASFALGFGHPLLMDGWRPYMPNYIPIGMMNCRPPKQLDPKTDKIGKFLNDAKEGVVYVSFGSVLQVHAVCLLTYLKHKDIF